MTIPDDNPKQNLKVNRKSESVRFSIHFVVKIMTLQILFQALAQLHHKSIVKSDHVTTPPINSIWLTWASWLIFLPCDQTFQKFKKWQVYNFIKCHIKSCFLSLVKICSIQKMTTKKDWQRGRWTDKMVPIIPQNNVSKNIKTNILIDKHGWENYVFKWFEVY